MRVIYKYALTIRDTQEISMPKHSSLLHIEVINDIPFLWALVDTDEKFINRTIHIYGTGQDIGYHSLRYVGTFMLYDEDFVGHVFG